MTATYTTTRVQSSEIVVALTLAVGIILAAAGVIAGVTLAVALAPIVLVPLGIGAAVAGVIVLAVKMTPRR